MLIGKRNKNAHPIMVAFDIFFFVLLRNRNQFLLVTKAPGFLSTPTRAIPKTETKQKLLIRCWLGKSAGRELMIAFAYSSRVEMAVRFQNKTLCCRFGMATSFAGIRVHSTGHLYKSQGK